MSKGRRSNRKSFAVFYNFATKNSSGSGYNVISDFSEPRSFEAIGDWCSVIKATFTNSEPPIQIVLTGWKELPK